MNNTPHIRFDECTVTDVLVAFAGSRDSCICNGHATNIASCAFSKITV